VPTSGRHPKFLLAAGCEQKLARLLTGCLDVGIHRLAGLFRQFKADGSPGLSLAHGCPIGTIAIGSNILDLERDDISAS
jgi:hypothetical protein